MTEPLSAETLAGIRMDHANRHGICYCCPVNKLDNGDWIYQDWPCPTAILLAELDRREANPPRWQGRDHHAPVPHLALLAGVQAGLFGPTTAEELAR